MVPFWPDAELGKACLWHVHTLLSTVKESVYCCGRESVLYKIYAISSLASLIFRQTVM